MPDDPEPQPLNTAEIRTSQDALEHADRPTGPIRESQATLELTERHVDTKLYFTHQALEFNKWPVDETVKASQVVLEVVYKPLTIIFPTGSGKFIPQYIKRHNLFSH